MIRAKENSRDMTGHSESERLFNTLLLHYHRRGETLPEHLSLTRMLTGKLSVGDLRKAVKELK
jgi:hypothetical protein